MKIPVRKTIACVLFLACPFNVLVAKDEDKAQKTAAPSLELLQFIGDFTNQKNKWEDPIETAEMLKQKENTDKASQERNK